MYLPNKINKVSLMNIKYNCICDNFIQNYLYYCACQYCLLNFNTYFLTLKFTSPFKYL